MADDRYHEVRSAKRDLNALLGREPDHELHWSSNLKGHDKRYVAAEALARLPVWLVYVVIEKATLPAGSRMGASRDAIYNYPLRLLLERVSWLVDDAGGEAAITLAAVHGLPGRVPRRYIERLRSGAVPTEIRWHALRRKVEIHQAASRDGLQFADIAAGALDRAIRPSVMLPSRIEPAYLELLGSRIYVRADGKIASYGMKALPAALWARYPWWRQVSRLPRNV